MRGERLFRQEALDEHVRAFDKEGTVLRIAPAWTAQAYWLLAGVAGAGLAFLALASVPRYAEGPAFVRVERLEGAAIPREGERPEVLAFLPGHHLASLLPGMTLRLELDGWPQTYHEVTVETVGTSVLGPEEARRALGDSLPLTGPVVLLRARLPAGGFRARGRNLDYHDGMVGRAEVRLESERLLFVLVPSLRGARGD